MSALSAFEAPCQAGPGAGDTVGSEFGQRQRMLSVVDQPAAGQLGGTPVRGTVAAGPRSSSIGSAQAGPLPRMPLPRMPVTGAAVLRSRPGTAQAPLRLTRRGRIVLAGIVIAGLTVAALLLSLVASGGAQATDHGQAGAGYRGMREIVVQPGQTLWSIASAAEPTGDTRAVISQIMSANALTGPTISVGQQLWIPR